jgi:hypothetical protein
VVTVRRRSLVAVASLAAVSVFPRPGHLRSWPFSPSLGGEPFLAAYKSPSTQSPICKLAPRRLNGSQGRALQTVLNDIGNLEFRCLNVALALDSNGDGPVIPPERGTIGIIPALADFMVTQDHVTEEAIRHACLRMLDVSESLISEVTNAAAARLLCWRSRTRSRYKILLSNY